MTMIRRIQPWRRLAEALQAVLIIGLPFIKIKGESALRFDVPALKLHFFGLSLWMEEFFIVLIATIFFSFLVIFITLLLGRVWCGWLCPQTVIADITAFAEKALNRGGLYTFFAWLAALLISIVVAANLIWYFVSPYEFIPRVFAGTPGSVIGGFWAALTGILFLNFILLRQKFCATVCPYAKLQSVLFDASTLVVAFDPRRKKECIDCMACVKACPVGIDIRKGLNAACIHCAECIDMCKGTMEPRRKKSLVGYFFGQPGDEGPLLRSNAVLFGAVTTAFLVFFVVLLVARQPLDMTVVPNYSFQPGISSSGSAVNSYIISLKNRGRADAELIIKVTGVEGSLKVVPDRVIHIKAGEMKKLPIYVSINGIEKQQMAQAIEIRVQSLQKNALAIKRKVNFIVDLDN